MSNNPPQIEGYTWRKTNPERSGPYNYMYDYIPPSETVSGYGYHLMMNKTGTHGEVVRFPGDVNDTSDWSVLKVAGRPGDFHGEQTGRRVMGLIRQAERRP